MNERIRFLLEGFSRAGGIRVISHIANWLADDHWNVEIVAPDYSCHPHYPLDPRIQIRTIQTRGRSLRTRRLEFHARLAVGILPAADFVVTSRHRLLPQAVRSTDAGRFSRVVYLIQHLAPLAGKFMGSERLGKILAGLGYRVPVHHVAVSRWLADQARVGPEAVVIPNPVDTGVFKPGPRMRSKNDRFRIGVVARPGWVKGMDVFSRALDELPPQSIQVVAACPDDFTLDLPSACELERRTLRTDTEMADFYRSVDVFVLCSRREGFGMPGLEAMACATPLVVTNCGGTREYASPSNSRLVPVGDYRALGQAIKELQLNARERRTLASSGADTAKSFKLSVCRRQYLDYFRELRGVTVSRS